MLTEPCEKEFGEIPTPKIKKKGSNRVNTSPIDYFN